MMWSPRHVAHALLGLAIWAVWFVLLYGGLSVACAVAPPSVSDGSLNWLNTSLLVLTLGTTVLLLFLAWRSWSHRRQSEFFAIVAAGCHLSAAGATLLVGLPVLALPPCL